MTKFAFKCNNCGALAPASAAGENELPRSCRICGYGDDNPDNWLVLADLTEKQLKEIGIAAVDVEVHEIEGVTPPKGRTVVVQARETVGSKDKG